jgi:RNA polymerase sigma-70 factor (ECF subfamily)
MNDPRGASDSSLVIALARFDQDGLQEIYRRHASAVFGLAFRVVCDRQVAEDVTQEVFVRLWDDPQRFDAERGSLRTFLLTLTHRRAVDIVRASESRRRREDTGLREMELVVDDIEREVLDLAAAEEVRAAFQGLPEAERVALDMTYFQGHSYVEAARILGEPEGTIKTRIRSALRRMRGSLSSALAVGEEDR